MIDVRRLRDDPEEAKAALGRRGIDTSDADRAAELDQLRRRAGQRRDTLRARVNALSKQVGEARRAGDMAQADTLSLESRTVGDELVGLDAETAETERALQDLLLR